MNGHSQGLNVMGKLVANIIVEALQSAGAECYCGVVGDSLDRTARSLEKRRDRVDINGTRRGEGVRSS
jgi:hypothetical protein